MRFGCLLASLAVLLVGCLSGSGSGLGIGSLPKPNRELSFHDEAVLYEYPNGLRLFVAPDPYTSMARIDLRQRVGSRDDPAEKGGLAHFVEHMQYETSSGSDRTLRMRLGQLSVGWNGYTDWERTHYYGVGSVENLPALMEALASIVQVDCDQIEEEVLLREREVVRNEFRQRHGTIADEYWTALHRSIYPEGHPYHRYIGGDDESITRISSEDVCAFIEKYYGPERTTVVVAGAVDPEWVKGHADRILAPIKGSKAPLKRAIPAIESSKRTEEIRLAADHPSAAIAYALPSRWSKEWLAVAITLELLPWSLSKAIDRHEYIKDADFRVIGGNQAPVLVLRAELESADDFDRASRELRWAIEHAMARIGGNKYYFDVARQRLRASILRKAAKMSERGRLLTDYLEVAHRWGFYGTDINVIDNMAPKQVGGITSDVFDRDRQVIVHARVDESRSLRASGRAAFEYEPTGHAGRTLRVDPEDATRPIDVEVDDWPPIQPRVLKLENGMRVLLARSSRFPIMSIRALVEVGKTTQPDPRDAWLPKIAARHLSPGWTTDFPWNPRAFYMAGGSVDRSHRHGYSEFRVDGLSIYADFLIGGLAQHLVYGEYSQESIDDWNDRIRRQLLKPQAARDLRREGRRLLAMYGEHPHSLSASDNALLFSGLTAEELKEFKKSYYRPDRTILLVTGGIHFGVCEAHIREHFERSSLTKKMAKWTPVGTRAPQARIPPIRGTRRRYLAEIDERQVQTSLFVGFALREVTENHAARILLRGTLDRGVSGVRQAMGASYGVSGKMSWYPPYLAVEGQVDTQRAGEAIAHVERVLDRLRNGEGYEQAFVAARNAELEDLMLEMSDPQVLATHLSFMIRYHLPKDYLETLAKGLGQTTIGDVYVEAKEVLAADRAVYSVRGPREGVEAVYDTLGVEPGDIEFIQSP